MAKLVVAVEVFVAQRNADNPLHDQRLDGMLGIGRVTAVLEAGRQATGQAQHPIRGPQQQRTGVAGDGATIKGRNNRAAFSRCKRKQVRVTLCRHRGLPLLRDKALSQKNFRRFRAPMHLTLVRDAGYGYSRFCDLYAAWRGRLSPTMRQSHPLGERLFVDYAGQTVEVVDAVTGEVRTAYIFVAALGASNLTYAEARWTQGLADWLGCHVNTFAFLGGVTRQVVSDNLKAGVTT